MLNEPEVQDSLADPISTGIGPYKRRISDIAWVKAALWGMRENPMYWIELKSNVMASTRLKLSNAQIVEICGRAQSACASPDKRTRSLALTRLLSDLRKAATKGNTHA
jgi:hypothetical protein